MRTIYKYCAVAVLVTAPFIASAQTIDQQAQALLAQVAALQKQLAAMQNGGNQQAQGQKNCVVLNRNLGKGMSGPDVTQLQQFLVAEGLLSPDSVTGYFGALTEGAVKQWQAKNGIVSEGSPQTTGWGFVGPRTRTVMGQCGPIQPPPQNQCPVVPIPPNCNNPVPIKNAQACTVGWQCGSQLPLQTFDATPRSGAAPLTVKFWGTVTSANAGFCPGQVCASTLDFGDGSTGAVPLPSSENSSSNYELNHTYQKAGDYSARLYQGSAGQNKPLVGAPITISVTGEGGSTASTTVAVTGPTGTFKKGDSVTIAWTVSGQKPASGTLMFDLYSSAGVKIGTIFQTTTFVSGSATWKVPSSSDTNCSATQPNGLCGVNIAAGLYQIRPAATGVSSISLVNGATFTIDFEAISPSNFTVSVAPSTVEQTKTLNIKYKVKNAPTGSVVGLWLLNQQGQNMGLIASKLEADEEESTYPWLVPMSRCDANGQNCRTLVDTPNVYYTEPGSYQVLAQVYTPADAYLGGFIGGGNQVLPTYVASSTSSVFKVVKEGSGAGCLVLVHNLMPGDTDDKTEGEVSKLQRFLAEDSSIYPEGTISGFYGNATRRAVERWQAANGIATNGSPETNGYGAVGPKTRAAMAAKCQNNSAVNFRSVPMAGKAPLSVVFYGKTEANVSAGTYAVDFGDGTFGYMQTCSGASCGASDMSLPHIYQQNGTYVARISTKTGTQQKILGTLTIKVSDAPVGAQCAAITRTLSPDDTDLLTGGDVSRLQQFLAKDPSLYPEGLVTGFYGPATVRAVQRYQAQNGIISYGTPETTGYGAVGPATLAKIRCVSASGALVATPSSGAAPLTVKFTTNVPAANYKMDFGDGQYIWLDTANSSTTSHTYTTNGTYKAQLQKTDDECAGLEEAALEICQIGAITVVGSATVTVSGTSSVLSVSPASGNAPLTVTLTAKIAGCNGGYFTFVYGDGQSSDAVPVPADKCNETISKTHTYASNGTYTAQVKDQAGNILGSATVTVNAPAGGEWVSGTINCSIVNGRYVDRYASIMLTLTNGKQQRYDLDPAFTAGGHGLIGGGYGGGNPINAAWDSPPQKGQIYSGGMPQVTKSSGSGNSLTVESADIRCTVSWQAVSDPGGTQGFRAIPSSGKAPLSVTFTYPYTNDDTGIYIVDFGDNPYAPTFGQGSTGQMFHDATTWRTTFTYKMSSRMAGSPFSSGSCPDVGGASMYAYIDERHSKNCGKYIAKLFKDGSEIASVPVTVE